MAIANEDGMNVAESQYKDSFAEDAPMSAEVSEDEAFGITPPAEAVAAAESGAPAAAPAEPAEPAVAPELAAEAPAMAGESDQNAAPVAAAAAPESDEPTDPKEIQRKASWEGRLKKMEAELMAKLEASKAPVADTIEAVGEQAEAEGNSALGDAADKVAEQVEDGSMSVEQAVSFLSQEFGEEFVTMLKAISTATANEVSGKAVAAVRGDVDEIVSHISNKAQKDHFREIASAYPDFNDISNDPAFKEFVGAGGADAQRVAANGSAEEVIALIKSFKASSAPAPEATPAAEPAKTEPTPSPAGQEGPEGADAALGVRSGGLRLPAEPVSNNDFEGAWNEASKSK